MNGDRPAPSRNRPAPDATNVSTIVDQVELFGASRGAYGGVEFSEPAPAQDRTPEPVRVAHQRMSNTVGAESWLTMAEEWIDDRIADGLTVSADGMQAEVGTPPNAGLPAVAIRRAKVAGKIVRVGFAPSERPEARGHVVGVWGPR